MKLGFNTEKKGAVCRLRFSLLIDVSSSRNDLPLIATEIVAIKVIICHYVAPIYCILYLYMFLYVSFFTFTRNVCKLIRRCDRKLKYRFFGIN